MQFAAVQFSTAIIPNFDFAQYNRSGGQVRNFINNAEQTYGNTFTPTAIRYVA